MNYINFLNFENGLKLILYDELDIEIKMILIIFEYEIELSKSNRKNINCK